MSEKGLILYHSYLETMEDLSDTEFGRLVRAALEYSAVRTIRQLSGNERVLFKTIKFQIDRDSEKYEKVCERNKANGQKGGRKTQKTQSVISKPKKANVNKKENENENLKEGIANAIPKKKPDELFEKFWSIYPKKVAKQAAFKAFRKIPKIEATLSEILAGVEKWERSEQWQNPQFIPYPAKFLSEQRWEDEMQKGGVSYESNRQHSDRKFCTEYPE